MINNNKQSLFLDNRLNINDLGPCNRVHRNIVYIVSREENWGPNQLNINHLGEKQ